jgi:hypothetical protein
VNSPIKNHPSFDPHIIKSSSDFGRCLGTLMLEWSLDILQADDIKRIAHINGIKVNELDPQYVYNWVFQGIADILRNKRTKDEITKVIEDAKDFDQ